VEGEARDPRPPHQRDNGEVEKVEQGPKKKELQQPRASIRQRRSSGRETTPEKKYNGDKIGVAVKGKRLGGEKPAKEEGRKSGKKDLA